MSYQKRLAAAQRPGIEVAEIGGMLPFQVTGRYTATDRPFYLRARHGGWWLYIGEPGWLTDFLNWPWHDLVPVAEGDDSTGGYMEDRTGLAILVKHTPGGEA